MSDHKTRADAGIEVLDSEIRDQESTPPSYRVVTYPADFTLEGLVSQFEKGLVEIPAFQRKFVWTLKQASRLIESFLLGLPVPAIFLYRDAEEKQQVIDGQQRLRSVYYFFKGHFGEEKKGKHTTFRLTGLDDKSPYANKTYEELQDTDPTSFNRLNNAVLRSFVIQQLDPNDNSSIYHIFERLNTGGTLLVGQEIRNCVYAGPFNDLLLNLNHNAAWRAVFGKKAEDYRLRDVELILRFFALVHDEKKYQKPMKNFLNNFMGARKKANASTLQEYRATFEKTIKQVHESLGDTPFHLRTGLNAAAFDAVCVAFAGHSRKTPENIRQRFEKLKVDPKFVEFVTSGTTDELTIQGRLERARTILFG